MSTSDRPRNIFDDKNSLLSSAAISIEESNALQDLKNNAEADRLAWGLIDFLASTRATLDERTKRKLEMYLQRRPKE